MSTTLRQLQRKKHMIILIFRVFFLGKCVRAATKTMDVDRKQKITQSTSSAIFGVGTATKC